MGRSGDAGTVAGTRELIFSPSPLRGRVGVGVSARHPKNPHPALPLRGGGRKPYCLFGIGGYVFSFHSFQAVSAFARSSALPDFHSGPSRDIFGFFVNAAAV